MRTVAYNGNFPGQMRKPSKASGKKTIVEHPSNTNPLVPTVLTTAMKQCKYSRLQHL
jgi:hypothetical protein